jgi:threonine dehydrogenase-like Zn-dependent dehydrogenase
MRAAVLRGGRLVVDDVPEPQPTFGQVLVQVKACGICGSDLHFLKHGETMMRLTQEMRGTQHTEEPLDFGRDVFMGHEFSAEVIEPGPDTAAPPAGTLVTSLPVMLSMSGLQNLAYTNALPSGYGERMLLSAPLVLEVPNGLDARRAALTEPMAVGLHAVNRSKIAPGEGALVLGCGPVGLAVVAALRLKGIEPIAATDYSPTRRGLATQLGAHEVVDPADEPAFEAWERVGRGRPLVVFEAIGVPHIINSVMRDAPAGSRLLVVGVCMEPDTFVPFFGIGKEINIQFVLGYDPMEFNASLRSIAEGEIDVSPLITGTVDLDGIPGAFDDLAQPDRHCKILVEP